MKPFDILKVLVLTVSLLISVTFLNAATITGTPAAVSWHTATTCIGDMVPLTIDDIVIATGIQRSSCK